MTTYENFKFEVDGDGIALVTWDMPDRSMNVFTEEVMNELDAIIDQIAGSDAIKGAVITSGKETFSAWISTATSRQARYESSARHRSSIGLLPFASASGGGSSFFILW